MADKPVIAERTPAVMEVEPGTYYWCRCGRSQNQPYCDGSHKETEFSPIKVEITEKKKIAWCRCKHTNNPPYCDGTHKTLT